MKVSEHLSRDYHGDAAAKAESIITAMRNPSNKISVQLDAAAQSHINDNRQVLVPITESIMSEFIRESVEKCILNGIKASTDDASATTTADSVRWPISATEK